MRSISDEILIAATYFGANHGHRLAKGQDLQGIRATIISMASMPLSLSMTRTALSESRLASA